MYVRSDRGDRSYPFCPNCYNNPPFENMKKAVGCNDCTHETCEHSMTSNLIRPCTSCTYNGKLVLDTGSGPKKYYIACNRCQVMYQGIDKAVRVKVKTNEECETCRAKLVFAEFKPDASKGAEQKTKFTECIFCGPVLSKMLHLKGGHRKPGEEGDVNSGRGGGGFRRGGRGIRQGGRGRGGRRY